ncbi:MAG: hypothetical protein RL701_3314 [Pseudomonadota bacterium]|jgi:flagellar biogenesis protein FliO
MNATYAALGTLLVLSPLAVGVAQADQLRVTSYDMDDNGGTIRLSSDVPLGEPWLRIDNRMLRIWFPHIDQVARFDHERESSDPIHSLTLRPGAAETAVLRVELGARPLTRDDIEITRNGQHATVVLRMPGVAKPARTPAAPAVAAGPQLRAAEPAAAQPVAAPITVASPTPAPAQPANAQASALGTASGTKAEDAALGMLNEDSKPSQSPLLWLAVLSLLLGAVYAILQVFNRRKPVLAPSIEVIGTRRLGHRQELMIVRALGSDHLLLCTGGRAERVASSPTLTDLPLEPASAPDPEPKAPSQAGGIGLISRLSSQHRLNKLLDSVESEVDQENDGSEANARFGAELYSANRRQRTPLQSLPSPHARQSDAVAGITRLRQRKTS